MEAVATSPPPDRALAAACSIQQMFRQRKHSNGRHVTRVLLPSPDRLSASLCESPYNLSEYLENAQSKPGSVLYLAYGSNLSSETFQGNRGIKPLSQVNVQVPSLRLTFDLPGIPYSEPCFANSGTRDPNNDPPGQYKSPGVDGEKTPLLSSEASGEGDYRKDQWHKGLIGVVYEVTPQDYAHIIATEGGGQSYHDILVDCHPFASSDPTLPVSKHPILPPFKAHTLFAPAAPPDDDPPRNGGRFQRPDTSYAQPSARYLKLVTDGAAELGLPYEYQEYLHSLRSYTITTNRQRIGQVLFLSLWAPLIALLFAVEKMFQDEQGRFPRWLGKLSGALFKFLWLSYDSFFKPVFGDGERTITDSGDETGGETSGAVLKCISKTSPHKSFGADVEKGEDVQQRDDLVLSVEECESAVLVRFGVSWCLRLHVTVASTLGSFLLQKPFISSTSSSAIMVLSIVTDGVIDVSQNAYSPVPSLAAKSPAAQETYEERIEDSMKAISESTPVKALQIDDDNDDELYSLSPRGMKHLEATKASPFELTRNEVDHVEDHKSRKNKQARGDEVREKAAPALPTLINDLLANGAETRQPGSERQDARGPGMFGRTPNSPSPPQLSNREGYAGKSVQNDENDGSHKKNLLRAPNFRKSHALRTLKQEARRTSPGEAIMARRQPDDLFLFPHEKTAGSSKRPRTYSKIRSRTAKRIATPLNHPTSIAGRLPAEPKSKQKAWTATQMDSAANYKHPSESREMAHGRRGLSEEAEDVEQNRCSGNESTEPSERGLDIEYADVTADIPEPKAMRTKIPSKGQETMDKHNKLCTDVELSGVSQNHEALEEDANINSNYPELGCAIPPSFSPSRMASAIATTKLKKRPLKALQTAGKIQSSPPIVQQSAYQRAGMLDPDVHWPENISFDRYEQRIQGPLASKRSAAGLIRESDTSLPPRVSSLLSETQHVQSRHLAKRNGNTLSSAKRTTTATNRAASLNVADNVDDALTCFLKKPSTKVETPVKAVRAPKVWSAFEAKTPEVAQPSHRMSDSQDDEFLMIDDLENQTFAEHGAASEPAISERTPLRTASQLATPEPASKSKAMRFQTPDRILMSPHMLSSEREWLPPSDSTHMSDRSTVKHNIEDDATGDTRKKRSKVESKPFSMSKTVNFSPEPMRRTPQELSLEASQKFGGTSMTNVDDCPEAVLLSEHFSQPISKHSKHFMADSSSVDDNGTSTSQRRAPIISEEQLTPPSHQPEMLSAESEIQSASIGRPRGVTTTVESFPDTKPFVVLDTAAGHLMNPFMSSRRCLNGPARKGKPSTFTEKLRRLTEPPATQNHISTKLEENDGTRAENSELLVENDVVPEGNVDMPDLLSFHSVSSEESNESVHDLGLWRSALLPRHMNLFDELVNVAHRLVHNLVGRNSTIHDDIAMHDKVDNYRLWGLKLVEEMELLHKEASAE